MRNVMRMVAPAVVALTLLGSGTANAQGVNPRCDAYARDFAASWYGPVTDHSAMIYNTAGYFGVPVSGSRTASKK